MTTSAVAVALETQHAPPPTTLWEGLHGAHMVHAQRAHDASYGQPHGDCQQITVIGSLSLQATGWNVETYTSGHFLYFLYSKGSGTIRNTSKGLVFWAAGHQWGLQPQELGIVPKLEDFWLMKLQVPRNFQRIFYYCGAAYHCKSTHTQWTPSCFIDDYQRNIMPWSIRLIPQCKCNLRKNRNTGVLVEKVAKQTEICGASLGCTLPPELKVCHDSYFFFCDV